MLKSGLQYLYYQGHQDYQYIEKIQIWGTAVKSCKGSAEGSVPRPVN